VGQFSISNPTSGKITTDPTTIKQASRGYYGSCAPDRITQNRWGTGIGYCDYVGYYMKICKNLEPNCLDKSRNIFKRMGDFFFRRTDDDQDAEQYKL